MNRPTPPNRPAPPDLGAPTAGEVVRSVVLDVDVAWELVGTEAGLARWLGTEVRLDAEPDGAVSVRDDDGRLRRGRVTEVRPGRVLSFEWQPEADDGDEDRSTVTFTVDPAGDGRARVTVVEARAGGSVAACLDAGAEWDRRLLGLERGGLLGISPLTAVA